MKSKEDKIYSYIVLGLGLLFLYLCFYSGQFDYGWDYEDTYFHDFWVMEIGIKRRWFGMLYVLNQLIFILSYWYIREDLVKLLKLIHSKI